jgi:hypothetical protein
MAKKPKRDDCLFKGWNLGDIGSQLAPPLPQATQQEKWYKAWYVWPVISGLLVGAMVVGAVSHIQQVQAQGVKVCQEQQLEMGGMVDGVRFGGGAIVQYYYNTQPIYVCPKVNGKKPTIVWE